LTRALAAPPGPAGAAGAALVPTAYERLDESGGVRNRQLRHRSQRENTG
jgi:hypothetical protein